MPIRPSSVVVRRRPSSVVNFSIKSLISQKLSDNFLAPPAERQPSFSNTDLSVVRLSVRLSVCLSFRLSVRPSRLRGGRGRGISQNRSKGRECLMVLSECFFFVFVCMYWYVSVKIT